MPPLEDARPADQPSDEIEHREQAGCRQIQPGMLMLSGSASRKRRNKTDRLADEVRALQNLDERREGDEQPAGRERNPLRSARFTLYGDTRSLRRPRLLEATRPELAPSYSKTTTAGDSAQR